jgi:uncharacterized protein (TIGR03437 family)
MVSVNGKPAYLSYVSPTQINFQAPDDGMRGPASVVVTSGTGTASSTVTLAAAAPSMLLLDATHVAGIILRNDGTGSLGGGTYDLLGPTGSSLGYATVAARAGDVVELFATGLGPTDPVVPAGKPYVGAAPVTGTVSLRMGNQDVTPGFVGLSGAGLYQINVVIPAGLGTGDLPLQLAVNGAAAQSNVVISLR